MLLIFFLVMRNVRRAVQQIPRRTWNLRAQSQWTESIDLTGVDSDRLSWRPVTLEESFVKAKESLILPPKHGKLSTSCSASHTCLEVLVTLWGSSCATSIAWRQSMSRASLCALDVALGGELLNERGLCTRSNVLLSLIGACTRGSEFDSAGVFFCFVFFVIFKVRDLLSPSAQGSAAWSDVWGTWGWRGSDRPPTPGSLTTSWPFTTREARRRLALRLEEFSFLFKLFLFFVIHKFHGKMQPRPPPSSRPLISDSDFYLSSTPAKRKSCVHLWFSTAARWPGVDSEKEALGSKSSGVKTIKVSHKHTL